MGLRQSDKRSQDIKKPFGGTGIYPVGRQTVLLYFKRSFLYRLLTIHSEGLHPIRQGQVLSRWMLLPVHQFPVHRPPEQPYQDR